MPVISRDQVVAALAKAFRAALTEGHDVELPGLGSFRVEHRGSRLTEDDNGSTVLTPPEATIVFEPETSPNGHHKG